MVIIELVSEKMLNSYDEMELLLKLKLKGLPDVEAN